MLSALEKSNLLSLISSSDPINSQDYIGSLVENGASVWLIESVTPSGSFRLEARRHCRNIPQNQCIYVHRVQHVKHPQDKA